MSAFSATQWQAWTVDSLSRHLVLSIFDVLVRVGHARAAQEWAQQFINNCMELFSPCPSSLWAPESFPNSWGSLLVLWPKTSSSSYPALPFTFYKHTHTPSSWRTVRGNGSDGLFHLLGARLPRWYHFYVEPKIAESRKKLGEGRNRQLSVKGYSFKYKGEISFEICCTVGWLQLIIMYCKPGLVTHTCNHSTRETETGGSLVWCSLSYIVTSCLKNTKKSYYILLYVL
jgi:hypothetical protein